jgi:hypothetical protein
MPTAGRRFDHYEANPADVTPLRADHPALSEARTIFPSTVVYPSDSPRLLVSGKNQRKLGEVVTKGRWRGMPISCLTLEERATCPRSCHHWRSCMGNGMHHSRRHRHGPELEYLLPLELADLQHEHPAGFAVRLHSLGDFYDAAYAMLWARWLDEFSALHIFGFTARPRRGGIGRVVEMMNEAEPDRCAIRFSVAEVDGSPMQATTLWEIPETPRVGQVIVCPAQTGRTDACSSCGLCWSTDKPIGFIAHGNPWRNRVRNENM